MKFLIERGSALENDIVEALDMKAADVRRILYKLYDRNLVVPVSEKLDDERGWIVYRWYPNEERIKGVLLNIKLRILARVRKRLKYESENVFYFCGEPGHPKLTFTEAAEATFRCPKCGKALKMVDNTEFVNALTDYVRELEANIEREYGRKIGTITL